VGKARAKSMLADMAAIGQFKHLFQGTSIMDRIA
jgi:hypothetical protein